MNKWNILFLGVLGSCFVGSAGKEPFKAPPKSVPFLAYFTSRYRGMCAGILVSRSVVLTAAVCVINPISLISDTRPITIVVGTLYRHPRRGIRVPITKIITPKFDSDLSRRAHDIERSPATLLMKRTVPDILTEVPTRSVEVSFNLDAPLALQQECLMLGWHFFYKGDKIFPVYKFLLQRNLRAQYVNIVKMHEWCDALYLKITKNLNSIGYHDGIEDDSMICTRDGMYGAPFICDGKAVGMMMAPDAQWSNCTGNCNIIHLFHAHYLRNYFECIKKLFDHETIVGWDVVKKALEEESQDSYDYIPALYDRVLSDGESSSSQER